jgi:WXXGXW repeat (2 copies)
MNSIYNNTPRSSLAGLKGSLARVVVICGSLALFAGCESEPSSHVVSAPPPPMPGTTSSTTVTQTAVATPAPTQTTYTNANGQTVTTTTQQTQPANTIMVMQAPPALQQEVVLASPGPDYKWVPGYWTWRDSRYEWVSGHWEMPPHSDAVWVAPHYEPEASGGYRYYEGYWN